MFFDVDLIYNIIQKDLDLLKYTTTKLYLYVFFLFYGFSSHYFFKILRSDSFNMSIFMVFI